jgi:hypothetical protein
VKEKSPGDQSARTPAWPEAMIARNSEETRKARRSRRQQSHLWERKDIGTIPGGYTFRPHGSGIYKITPAAQN